MYGAHITPAMENAFAYIEGEPDTEYKSGERLMCPLAAFCHMCDIYSARMFPSEQNVWAPW